MIKRRCQWFYSGKTKKSPLIQCDLDAIDGDYCCQSHSGIDNSKYDGIAKYCEKCRNPIPCKCVEVVVAKKLNTNKKIKR